jgi:hypothetical protein
MWTLARKIFSSTSTGGIFAKGEIRKGRWGLLGDGFFAQLSASGDPPGPLYESANLTIKQGLASLALGYRLTDDRRGFLDIYAGALQLLWHQHWDEHRQCRHPASG